MLKKRKFNEKKLLHKIGKHWCVISIALLGLMGGFGVSQQRIYADSNNVASTNTSTQLSKVNTTANDSNNRNNTNQIQYGTWDNVNINYYPDNTMELTGNGTINPDHAPKQLPFNQNSNDWKLKIDQSKANVILDNSNGYQFSSINLDERANKGVAKKSVKKASKGAHKAIPDNSEVDNSASIWGQFKSMDLSGLDTSKVTNMSCMFSGDENLQSINISGLFSTKSVPEESNNYNDGLAGMFNGTYVGKLTLGKNTNFNKANQEIFDDNPLLDANGDFTGPQIMKGIQKPGTYYVASLPNRLNLHLIDSNSSKILSTQGPHLIPADEFTFPLIHDNNYQNIMSHEIQRVDKYLNIPNGYKELPDEQQNYTIHDSHNANIGTYINVKLVKDSNVNYQSEMANDEQLSNLYLKDFQSYARTTFNDNEESMMNNYGDDIDDGDIFNNSANSYTVSQANSSVQRASLALNAASVLASNDLNAENKSYSNKASSDQESSSMSSSSEIPDNTNRQSHSTSVSYVDVPTNNVEMNSYNDEINNLRNQVSLYSNEMNQMRGNIQSLESDVKNVEASASHASNSHGKATTRYHKRSVKRNYQLPRTNSKYWNRVRHLSVKHGFRVYQIHALAHHKNRVLRSKWIKPNQKVSVIRYRKSNKVWVVSNHNLHHYKHYYWIYKGDIKNPNHFKFVK